MESSGEFEINESGPREMTNQSPRGELGPSSADIKTRRKRCRRRTATFCALFESKMISLAIFVAIVQLAQCPLEVSCLELSAKHETARSQQQEATFGAQAPAGFAPAKTQEEGQAGASWPAADARTEFAFAPANELTILIEAEGGSGSQAAPPLGQRPSALPPGVDYRVFYPRRAIQRAARRPAKRHASPGKSGAAQAAHYNRTSVVIKAFDYKLRLDLELNDILFGPNLVQKHFIPKGAHISAHQLNNCYYHAKSTPTTPSSPEGDIGELGPSEHQAAIGAFRTCNGLSGIIHVNNESLVIHPFYNSDQSKKQPHIIYRYQTAPFSGRSPSDNGHTSAGHSAATLGECGNSRSPSDWTLRQYDKPPVRRPRDTNSGQHLLSKRDVGLVEKYIELALVLSKDMFTKRNASSRLEVLHDAIQIINCLDLYYRRSTNTRIGLVYIETWSQGDQIEISEDPKQTLYNLLDYSTRHLYGTSKDAVHLITGGHAQQFEANSFGMSIPDSICTLKAVSVSQESSVLEPFITAAAIAHLLGHNLGMEHDNERDELEQPAPAPPSTTTTTAPSAPPFAGKTTQSQTTASRPQEPDPASAEAEEHDDEVRSRSLTWEEAPSALGAANSNPNSNKSSDWLDQDQLETNECRWNCIMSERFIYSQPPIALGNLVQQSADSAATSSNSSPIDNSEMASNTFTIQEDSMGLESAASSNAHEWRQQQQQQQQQQRQQNQVIDLELAHSGARQDSPGSDKWAPSVPFRFSRRSIELYFGRLREQAAMCLWNKPNKLESSIVSTCGNGIVEHNEDCDCGSRSDCWQDTCCERLTCRFRKGVECISGACCDRCKFRQRGFVCRKARGECDLPELCDGNNYSCPPDLYKQNGFPCANSTGYCFMGQCPLHDAQCAELWGAGARNSDPLCYATMNTNGSVFGNCARPARTSARAPSSLGAKQAALHKLRRCEPENVLCGTLQCQHGNMKPVTADLNEQAAPAVGTRAGSPSASQQQQVTTNCEYSSKTLRKAGKEYECKVVKGPVAAAGRSSSRVASSTQLPSSISYVRDGSKCGDQHVCFNQTCQAIESVYADAFTQCPRNERGHFCSNHGVCSTANRCFCDHGWAGHDCSQAWQAQAAAPPAPQELLLDTRPMSMLATATAVGLLTTAPPGAPNSSGPNQLVQTPASTTAVANVASTQAPVPQTPPSAAAAATTTTTTTSAAPPIAPPQPQQTGTTEKVEDKKRQGALTAGQLVVILVVAVAGVYLGFAFMACCYRRKGIFKPDEVLRHHQLNCKMESRRKSLLKKRLAHPDLIPAGTFDEAPSSDHLLSPFGGHFEGSHLALFQDAGHLMQHQHALGPQQNQTAQATVHYFDHPQQQQQQQRVPHLGEQAKMQMNETFGFASGEVQAGDHIPLLSSDQQPHQQPLRRPFHNQPPSMRPFRVETFRRPANQPNRMVVSRQVRNPLVYQHQTSEQQQQMDQRNWTAVQTNLRLGERQRSTESFMNRAASLGNVSRQLQASQLADGQQDHRQQKQQHHHFHTSDTMRIRQMAQQNALATPSRARQASGQTVRRPQTALARDPTTGGSFGDKLNEQLNARRGQAIEENADLDDDYLLDAGELASCSAPSSPERAAVYWDNSYGSRDDCNYHEGPNLSTFSPRMDQRSRPSRQRDSLRRQLSRNDEGPLVPQPPPLEMSPSPSPSLPLEGVDEGTDSIVRPDEELPEEPRRGVNSSTAPRQQQQQLPAWMAAGKQPNGQMKGAIGLQEHHLSLVAQLQQLERVQKLHQKQTVGGGLHEFFSLPLSVQLSALLARNLAEASSNQQLSPTAHIDELLNTLNTSNVVISSRRSFRQPLAMPSTNTTNGKYASMMEQQQQQQPSSSRGGTMRKHQAKLQNLQSLISRLQKLHNQTMMQADFNDDANFDDGWTESVANEAVGNLTSVPSQQSTLGRSASRGAMLAFNQQAADDMLTTPARPRNSLQTSEMATARSRRAYNMRRSDSHRSRDGTIESYASYKNELVYSMSDSEDGGAYVNHMINRTSKYVQAQPAKGAPQETGPSQGDDTFAQVPNNNDNQQGSQEKALVDNTNAREVGDSQASDGNSDTDMSTRPNHTAPGNQRKSSSPKANENVEEMRT